MAGAKRAKNKRRKNYHECFTTPFKTGISNFNSVADFFLYYAPNIDSPHSSGVIEGAQADSLYKCMLKETDMRSKSSCIQRIQPNSWKKLELDEDVLDFETPRMVFHRFRDESELRALSRHLRNALAHGFIYVWKKKSGNYIFFVDKDSKKEKITAKIMVSMKILETWKALIEGQVATGE